MLKYLVEAMTPGAWFKACTNEIGVSRKTFYRRIADVENARLIERDGNLWKRRNQARYPGERED